VARTVDPEQVARRREAIAVAAGRLFGTQGFERTTVADIARATGLSTGSVFYYFPDKRAVFRAVFERDLPVSEALVTRFANAGEPVAAVLDMATELAKDACEPGAAGMVFELLRQIDRDEELASVVLRTTQVVRDGLAGLVARGIADGTVDAELDPVEAAAWIQVVVDAVYLNADDGRDDTPALRRTVARYLAPPQASQISKGDDENGS
jgi:TetR/AcrR family transcriptional regulator, transcriptional repressor of aconitase